MSKFILWFGFVLSILFLAFGFLSMIFLNNRFYLGGFLFWGAILAGTTYKLFIKKG